MKLLDLLEVKVDTHGSFVVKQDLYLILSHAGDDKSRGWCLTPDRELDEFRTGVLKRGDKLIWSHDYEDTAVNGQRYPNYKVIDKDGHARDIAEFSIKNLTDLLHEGVLKPL